MRDRRNEKAEQQQRDFFNDPKKHRDGTDDDPYGEKEAIERVRRHANAEWRQAAYLSGAILAESHRTLTSLDVRRNVHPRFNTHEPRALGAVMRALAKNEIIEPTGDYVKSNLRHNHNRPVRVWASLIYEEEE
jgi:hypothetical protein